MFLTQSRLDDTQDDSKDDIQYIYIYTRHKKHTYMIWWCIQYKAQLKTYSTNSSIEELDIVECICRLDEEMDHIDIEVQETVPLDLELFALEEWKILNKKYNLEFYIFCSKELKVVSSICNKFKKMNDLI